MTEQPLQLIPLLETIRPELEAMECLIHERLAEVGEPLCSMLQYSLDGGKQLRPALVILIGQMFASGMAPFCGLAVAIEMLHTATLIHDDLVDDADLRRGRKSVHKIWPVATTVLAGDYLLGQATSLIAELEHPRILKVFGDILCTMCAGEIRQTLTTEGRSWQREEYYRSMEAKTASLFSASTEMAGVLAKGEETQVTALRRFGQEFGAAFQIVDDVLDFVGDEAQLGKLPGSDLRHGLITMPVVCYLERVTDDVEVKAVLSGQRDEEHVQAAIEVVCASGAIEDSLEVARHHAKRSQEALAGLPPSTSRQMMNSLAQYVVERRH